MKFFEKHINSLNWFCVSQSIAVDIDFLEKHLDRIDWESVCWNPIMTVKFLEKHIDKIGPGDFAFVEAAFDLKLKEDVNFVEKYLYKFNLSDICNNFTITTEFLERHINELDDNCWRNICKNSSIEISFIERYIDKVNINYYSNWLILCSNIAINDDFLERHIHEINECERFHPNHDVWCNICSNPSITSKFYEAHLDKINSIVSSSYYFAWEPICRNPSIDLDFIGRHIDKLTGFCIDYILRNPKTTPEFIKKLFDDKVIQAKYPVVWDEIFTNPNIPLTFIEENMSKFVWNKLPYIKTMTIAFIEKWLHVGISSNMNFWITVCGLSIVTEDFLEKHIDEINKQGVNVWKIIIYNDSVPITFIEKHLAIGTPNEKIEITHLEGFWSSLCENRFTYQKQLDITATKCAKVRRKINGFRIPNRLQITKLILTSKFNSWWYRPDKCGGQNTKRSLYSSTLQQRNLKQ